VSQFYEWLAYNHGYADKLPPDEAGRKAWLKDHLRSKMKPRADRHRQQLIETYGPERGAKIEFVESFEGCEYGAPLDAAAKERLFACTR
jgi:hypothetical protein